MWHFISEQIRQQIKTDFSYDDIQEVSNGDSHQAFKLSDGKQRFFVKVNSNDQLANFTAEAEGLKHLAASKIFRLPTVICCGRVATHSFLVLEHISMNQGNEYSWQRAGEKLAQLHQQETQQMYGWQEDNFIGTTPQANMWHRKWCQFFAEQRIGIMLQRLAEQGHHLANIEQSISSVKSLLAGHQPTASMLHGDLWHGNIGFHHEQAILFDPAFYFGDRETDIAMTELFSRFPAAFYQGYNSVWPLEEEYEYRKSVYQLYHILNHALLFGGHYLESAKVMLKNLDN